MVATYWLSFEYARDPRAPHDGRALARGAFHVISLAAPYLAPSERELFDRSRQTLPALKGRFMDRTSMECVPLSRVPPMIMRARS